MTIRALTIEEDIETPKTVTLQGTAIMGPADDILEITIPAQHVAPSGRILDASWTIEIKEEED